MIPVIAKGREFTFAVTLINIVSLLAANIGLLLNKVGIWPAITVSFFTTYMLTAMIHECYHNAAHTNKKVNQIFGLTLGALLCLPFKLMRASHLNHHRFSETEKDPDLMIYSIGLKDCYKIFFINFSYLLNLNLIPFRSRIFVLGQFLATVGVVIVFPVLFLSWILPGYIAGTIFGIFFIILPHHGNEKLRKSKVIKFLIKRHKIHHVMPAVSLWNINVYDPKFKSI